MSGTLLARSTLTAPNMRSSVLDYDTLDARKTALLRTFYAALANRNAGPCDILIGGDSASEGARATSLQNRWPSRFRDMLRTRMGQTPAGGFGYIPAHYQTTDMVSVGPVSYSDGTSGATTFDRGNYGFGRRCEALASAGTRTVTLTLTPGTPFVATSVDIWYPNTSTVGASINVRLDGGAWVNLGTNAAVRDGYTYRFAIPNLTATHTIDVVASSGASNYVNGFALYNGDEAAGIRVWEGAHSGSDSSWFAATKPTTYWYDCVTTLQPALVIIELLINDYYNGSAQGQTPAQAAANLTAIISQIRAACTTAPSIVLMVPYQRGSVGVTPHAWGEYVAAAYQVAIADGGVAVFDWAKRFPPGVQTTTGGLINADLTHPTDKGYGFIADAFTSWLVPR